MSLLTSVPFVNFGDVSGATNSIHSYVVPLLSVLDGLGLLVCTFVLIYSGYMYMTSSADPGRLQHAKRNLRNALIGLLIVLAASAATAFLHHAYTAPAAGSTSALPTLTEVKPEDTHGGWSTILIDALSGFFSSIVTSMFSPVIHALSKLTDGTPLMSTQAGVFNLWLVILGIANVLFVLVLTLLGFRVMTGEMLGLGEIELRSMVPQIGFVFLLMNTSIFAIDAVIGLSNAIISAVYAGFPGLDIWHALTSSMGRLSGLPLVSLIMFVVFVIFAMMLLVYYVARLIMLFLGAAMSPFVVLLWLLPGFRDFANNLIRTYLMVIFVLLVHVVILMLGATLLDGQNSGGVPNPIMVITIGIATLFLLLKSQSVLIQMSVVSSGANQTRKLGTQFANGMRYTGDKIEASAGKQLVDLRSRYAVSMLKAAK
jgi:hypothetical protein